MKKEEDQSSNNGNCATESPGTCILDDMHRWYVYILRQYVL